MFPLPCPCSLMTPGMKAPLAQHCSLCSQPGSMNNGRTNTFVLQLERQDKQGTELGANCNTTDWQPALFPAPYKYWSQLSAPFAVFLGRPQHPQNIDVWLCGPERAMLSWGPLVCSSSPSSQAGLRNLLLLLLLQALKPTGKPEFNLTAAEYSWIKTHWPSKILLLKCNLCLALNTLGEFKAICTTDQPVTPRKKHFDAPDLHPRALMHFGNRQQRKKPLC